MLKVAHDIEFDLSQYQNETHLRDETKILIRPMVAKDMDVLYEFFKAVPRDKIQYLRDDVSIPRLIEKWANNLDYDKTLPILAVKDT